MSISKKLRQWVLAGYEEPEGFYETEKEVEAHHRLVTPGVRLDAGRANDEGDADAPLSQAALAAGEEDDVFAFTGFVGTRWKGEMVCGLFSPGETADRDDRNRKKFGKQDTFHNKINW